MAAAYARLLETWPVLTKSATAGALLGLGDCAVQRVVEGGAWDRRRTAKLALLGGLMVGPTLHAWYGWLGRAVPGTAPSRVATRVAADQFAFAPVFLSAFLGVNYVADGKPEPARKVREDIVPVLKTNWMVWIPYQAFVFSTVPLKWQVLANNVCGAVWNGYLSFVAHRQPAPAQHAASDARSHEPREA